MSPWVVTVSEATALPEAHLGGVDIKDNVVRGVDVGSNAVLRPKKTINVEVISERGITGVLLSCELVFISIIIWSPVESGSKFIVAASFARGIVTTRLHDIDLTRSGPASIGFVSWEHPDGWPDPVTLR